MREPGAAGSFGGDERAGNGSQTSVECELADRGVPVERFGRQLVRGCEHGQCDWQIEPRPFLARAAGARLTVMRRLVGHSSSARRSGTHPFLRLLARAVGKADDRERRQPLLQMRFDLDPARIDADERVGDGACEHTVTLGGNP